MLLRDNINIQSFAVIPPRTCAPTAMTMPKSRLALDHSPLRTITSAPGTISGCNENNGTTKYTPATSRGTL